MKYVCVKCRYTWSVNHKNHSVAKLFLIYLQLKWKREEPPISGGVCESCITEYVRGKQKQRGEDDCFKRIEICDKEDCRYRDFCCKDLGQKRKGQL